MRLFHVTILVFCVVSVAGIFSCVPPQRYEEETNFGTVSSDERALRKSIIHTAKAQIGVPYKLGGMSPRGFDCSGFTLYSYRRNGVRLPRTAAQQYRFGKKIVIRQARPGDLLFFDTNGGRVSHVAVYLGKGSFVHSPSTGNTVRVDSVRNPYWKTHYCGAARYIR